MNRIPGLLVRQVLLLLLIFALGWVLFFTLHPYLPALLGAYTMYVLLRPAMNHLSVTKKWNKILVALLLILLAVVVIWGARVLFVQLVQGRVIAALHHSPEFLGSMEELVSRLKSSIRSAFDG